MRSFRTYSTENTERHTLRSARPPSYGPDNLPKLPLACPSDFVTLPEENRATAMGNMHRKIGKDRTCDSGDMLADTHAVNTNKHYF